MRYYVTIHFEVHAETDQEAKELATQAAKDIGEMYLNPVLETIHRAPFGQFGANKEIFNHLTDTV